MDIYLKDYFPKELLAKIKDDLKPIKQTHRRKLRIKLRDIQMKLNGRKAGIIDMRRTFPVNLIPAWHSERIGN